MGAKVGKNGEKRERHRVKPLHFLQNIKNLGESFAEPFFWFTFASAKERQWEDIVIKGGPFVYRLGREIFIL